MTETTVFLCKHKLRIHPIQDCAFQIAFKCHSILMLFIFNGLSIRNQRNVNSDTDIGIQQECAKTMQTEIQMVMSNFVCF